MQEKLENWIELDCLVESLLSPFTSQSELCGMQNTTWNNTH